MKITFYGGAGEVTGTNYILESASGVKIMVDCGLRQGGHDAERSNWDEFGYDVKNITALFVTHSHIDHVGRIPLLVKRGFTGKIYSTPPARDVARELLLDSQHLLSMTAERIGLPLLYREENIETAMGLWEGIPYHHPITVGDFTITLYNAGHVLGSSSILAQDVNGTRMLFSGDLGNSPAPLLGDKDSMPEAEYCCIESAYGNRLHEDRVRRKEILEDVIEKTVKDGGVLMIPAFSFERTQELLSEVDDLVEQGSIPRIPVYLDSPLAIRLTEVYLKYHDYLKGGVFDFDFPDLHMTETTEQSRAINQVPSPKIIIAGSGMSTGGRIVHHERRYLPDPKSTILFIGYQSEGTLGRRIMDGAKSVIIFGEEVQVNCHVKVIGGYSAHADQAQLLAWIAPHRDIVRKVFVVQGENDAATALAQKMRDNLAINAEVPVAGASYDLLY